LTRRITLAGLMALLVIAAQPARAAAADTTPPTTPPGLHATVIGATTITLDWLPSTDDTGVVGYSVRRDGEFVVRTIGTIAVLTSLPCGTSSAFQVVARDAAGNRSRAANLTVSTLHCALPAATRFVSPAGSDGGDCTAGTPCRTLDRAYHAASPGEVVDVAAGRYPVQTIGSDGSKTSADDVVFRPAAGAAVSIDGITFDGARHLSLEGFHLTDWWGTTSRGASDLTMRDIVATAGFDISYASGVSVIGGSYGPWHATLGTASYNHVGFGSSHILIDGVTFHDWTRSSADVHTECLHVSSVDGLTVRRSRFVDCAVFDIFLTYWSGPVTRNITIENNFFDEPRDLDGGCCAYYSVQSHVDGSYSNVLIRNNSDLMGYLIVGNLANVRIVGNAGAYRQNDCQPDVAYSHNVWDGAACGPTDLDAAASFVNPAIVDLHLLPGAAAIGRGDPGNHPATDIDGDPRPLTGPVDAGADER
jgi:hypothetical protein